MTRAGGCPRWWAACVTPCERPPRSGLYTDGLIERRSTGQDIDAGTAALARTLTGLHHLPADAILDRVLDPVRYDREDDIAALAIRVEG